MKSVYSTVLNTWDTMRRQEWECPWNFILVTLQFAILFFFIALRNAYVDNWADWAEESLLFRDMKIVLLRFFGSHAVAMILMLVCFRLIVGTVPNRLRLSLVGFGKEIWLAASLVVSIMVLANLSKSVAYIPPVMYLPDLSVIRILQGVVVIPLVEEWLFRGILYPYLRKHLPFMWAVVANVILFALCHYNMDEKFLDLLPHLGLGLVLVLYYERSRSIGACIVIHGVANMVPAFVFLYRVYMLESML